MKTSFKIHSEVREMNTLPGRYYIATQYCENGLIIVDSNDGKGYTEEEALALATHGANLVYNN